MNTILMMVLEVVGIVLAYNAVKFIYRRIDENIAVKKGLLFKTQDLTIRSNDKKYVERIKKLLREDNMRRG